MGIQEKAPGTQKVRKLAVAPRERGARHGSQRTRSKSYKNISKKRAEQHAFGFNIAKVAAKIQACVWGAPTEEKEENVTSSSCLPLQWQAKFAQLQQQLQSTQKELQFVKEKCHLLQSVLDDANIDQRYLESRRDMKNIERDNLKPTENLPPSPVRAVNPLVTSSPIHMSPLQSRQRPLSALQPPKGPNFYAKYPKLPHTNILREAPAEDSLPPAE
ncbi:YPR174C [Saccharomyces arboricola H-6]|uniref:YPR174C n=1 Tax=Saccharomyces arboricola (strain H-6 / AS 2.3317 / CBS 10644) TaxID=1160507 RepID=J8Q0S0_SACAR|nr:YPR174C [Saccharomyces arboricola H-6]